MENQQEKQPTKEEVLAFLNESLEIAEIRAKLQTFNTQIAVGRAEELKALMFISQVTNPQNAEGLEEHTLTEEDLSSNPELKDSGFKVGDEVKIPSEIKRKLKTNTKEKV